MEPSPDIILTAGKDQWIRIDLERKLSRLFDRVAQAEGRLDYMGVRMDSHDERFDDIDKQLGEIRELVEALGPTP